jgi:hypothetical protein
MKTDEPIYYKKVFIESEDDLPKEVDNYHVKLKNGEARLFHFPFKGDVGYNIFKLDWLEDVEYYLQPVEPTVLTDEEISVELDFINPKTSKEREDLFDIACWARDKMLPNNDMIELVNAYDQLEEHQSIKCINLDEITSKHKLIFKDWQKIAELKTKLKL